MALTPKRAKYCEQILLNSSITEQVINKAKKTLEKVRFVEKKKERDFVGDLDLDDLQEKYGGNVTNIEENYWPPKQNGCCEHSEVHKKMEPLISQRLVVSFWYVPCV